MTSLMSLAWRGLELKEPSRCVLHVRERHARDELSVTFGQQEEEIQGDTFKIHGTACAAKFAGAPVKLEIVKTQDSFRQCGIPRAAI